MVEIPFLRSMLIFLSVLAFHFIDYEDSKYKPFGVRYWISLVACIWINCVTFISYFIVCVGGSIMVYNKLEQMLVWIFVFALGIALGLTFLSWKAIKILIRRTKYYRRLRK